MAFISVILAGGGSKRMGVAFKQFLKIGGKPLIFCSLEKFVRHPLIGKTVVVVPEEKFRYASRIVYKNFPKSNISIVKGGKTRRFSSYKALLHLKENKIKADYVIFHDAARPLVSAKMISQLIKSMAKNDAVVYGKKAIDLIFQIKSGYIEQVINKENIFYGYTPQCFRFSSIYEAHKKYLGDASMEYADNTELLMKFNKRSKIKILDCPYPNLKLTYKPDVKMIKLFLK